MATGRKTGGRTKGVPNKTTRNVREVLATLAESNIDRCQEWLDAIAKIDPAKAMDLYLRLIEYHVPKLARSELDVDARLTYGAVSTEPLTPEQWEAQHGAPRIPN